MIQDDKIFLNLAGEFAVASELNRRQIVASVTYGASKSADVFAMNREMTKLVRVEVKATNGNRWMLGTKVNLEPSRDTDMLWILVQLPFPILDVSDTVRLPIGKSLNILSDDQKRWLLRGFQAPRFFVLTARELYDVWRVGADEYKKRHLARNKVAYSGREVPNVPLGAVTPFEDAWGKITKRLSDDRLEARRS
jgi:hypothetical protein